MDQVNSKPPHLPPGPQNPWYVILGLIGLDYFSTLGYQPSIAYEAAGLLAPIATVVVVVVTLFAALPLYAYVAGRSPDGQGSTAMLERLVPGWAGKVLVLVLLGFAATDFVFTKTLSVADAAEHLVRNPIPLWQESIDTLASGEDSIRGELPSPFWQRTLDYWDQQMVVTVLLLVLSFSFWMIFRRGFTRRVLRMALWIVALYLLLNAVVIGSGLIYLGQHPDILDTWYQRIISGVWGIERPPLTGQGWVMMVLACILLFPKLALGLSGFEMSMVAMPLIRGSDKDDPQRPKARIRKTRTLLAVAAIIMSVYLLGSALVTSTLLAPEAFTASGQARNRSLAYLAHGQVLADGQTAAVLNPLFGNLFGSIYDLNSVLILCLAGASITLGLRTLVPRYLQRFGMELSHGRTSGVIIHVFNAINVVITLLFRASVNAQRGAYATSVLVLIGSAALTSAVDRWRSRTGVWARRFPWYFGAVAGIFLLTALAVMVERWDGLLIAGCFILATLVLSMISRLVRSTELRFQGFRFKDDHSRFLWESLMPMDFPVLVPHRPGRHSLAEKEASIRERHRLAPEVPIVFVEAALGDVSEFYQLPMLEVVEQEGRFVIRVTQCASIPHVIAAIGLELSKLSKPPEIHFGWSNETPMAANLHFVLFGEGNVPWMVRELIRKAEPRLERQPRVIIG